MGLMRLNAESLPHVDFGRPNEAFLSALKRVVADCVDRPTDSRARKVVMTFTLVPIPQIDGATVDCVSADGKFNVTAKIPDYETAKLNFGVQQNGDLIFSSGSPQDHRQQTFTEFEEEPEQDCDEEPEIGHHSG